MAYIGKIPTAAALTSSDISDGIITNAKLAQDIISADTALGAEPADTDELLVSDAGVLKRMDYSYIKSGGNVPYFRAFRDSSAQSISVDTDTLVAFNAEDFDSASAFNVSTYKFIPQTAGKYYLHGKVTVASANDSAFYVIYIKKNGSTAARKYFRPGAGGALGLELSTILAADGDTDYFTVEVFFSSAEDISSSTDRSFFEGFFVGT